jgi:hypothetical protein
MTRPLARCLSLLLLLFPAGAFAQGGIAGGAPVTDGATLVDVAVHGTQVWVAWADATDRRQVHVATLAGGAWQEVGPVPAPAVASDHLELVFKGDEPHVLFAGPDGLTVIRWDGAAWHREGKAGFGRDVIGYELGLAFAGAVPHVVHHDEQKGRTDLYALAKLEAVHVWGGVDGAAGLPAGTEQPSIASTLADELIVADHDRKRGRIAVHRLPADGSSLEPVGKPMQSKSIANFLGVRTDDNTVVIAWEDSAQGWSPVLAKLDAKGKKWAPMTSGGKEAGIGTNGFDWTAQGAVGWLAEDGKAMASRWDGTAWMTPTAASTGPAAAIAVASSGDGTWVAFIDGERSGKLLVRQLP